MPLGLTLSGWPSGGNDDAVTGAAGDRRMICSIRGLNQIIDMTYALLKLARAVDWRVLEERFGSVYTVGPGSLLGRTFSPISGQNVQKRRRLLARSATIIVLMLPTYVPPLAGKLVPRFVFR